jgi:hypothetical protein
MKLNTAVRITTSRSVYQRQNLLPIPATVYTLTSYKQADEYCRILNVICLSVDTEAILNFNVSQVSMPAIPSADKRLQMKTSSVNRF